MKTIIRSLFRGRVFSKYSVCTTFITSLLFPILLSAQTNNLPDIEFDTGPGQILSAIKYVYAPNGVVMAEQRTDYVANIGGTGIINANINVNGFIINAQFNVHLGGRYQLITYFPVNAKTSASSFSYDIIYSFSGTSGNQLKQTIQASFNANPIPPVWNIILPTGIDSCRLIQWNGGGPNWTLQTSGTTNNLSAISFADANNGTAVGDKGTILRTTNGGTNWTLQTSGTTNDLSAISFTDANTGTAVGSGGTILRTTNGGASWTSDSSGTTNSLTSVSFTDANTGTAIAITDGTILRTTNGGASWKRQQPDSAVELLYGVSFTNANNGTAVGGGTGPDYGGKILHTTDGGVNWTSQSSGTTDNLYAVTFTDVTTGIAVGGGTWFGNSGGTILRTTNGGSTWTRQTSGTTFDLHGVSFIDANTGTAVGDNGTILRTTNGGASWTSDSSGTMFNFRGVSFTDANTGTIVGNLGIILRTKESATSVENKQAEIPKNFTLLQNYPNPFNPSTTISFNIPKRSNVSLKIFDLLGREVATIVSEEMLAGNHSKQWNAANMSSGIYFYRLYAGSFTETKKFVLLK
ncbi:MAG: YCF48-related protein [Bacteroidota bacterium]|jgi:photosystem II stability/assembly factor-like uncharacterized protein